MRKPKKLLNNPNDVPTEQLEGLIAACHGDLIPVDNVTAVIRRNISKDQVAVLIGGGSGHEPMFAGYVGEGLADAAALGEIFTSPSPFIIIEAAKAASQGNGVLFIYGCYAGDNMNFDIAAELLEEEGIITKTVRVNDDIASAPLERRTERRGVAGDLIVLKIAGAAAQKKYDLNKIHQLTEKANYNTRTIGVALSACSLPASGNFNFEIPDGELELGMGIHGEHGVRRQKIVSADEMVKEMVDRLCDDLPFKSGDNVCVVINNLGASTYSELLIAYRKVSMELAIRNINIYDTNIGSFCTAQEMSGFSITFFKLDDELKELYDMPCNSFGWRK